MTDKLAERLRAWSRDDTLGDGMLLREAADEIDRLKSENHRLREELHFPVKLKKENERLKEMIKKWKEASKQ